jgi:hypothetical protein
VVRFNHSAGSIALVIINIVFYDVVFVGFSNTWQQTLTIHPNNNRGTETQQSTSDFDANGNLLTLNIFAYKI